MGESRQELLAWMNSLLQLNVTKVEQCGTGAALCQIFDSIFLDVPMAKVKFNVNTEYAYIQNFKVLQGTFTKHQIDRSIPIESLVKCKMQDNLEFLQWSKRFWDQHFPGLEYDPVARRKAVGTSLAAGPSAVVANRSGGSAARRPAPAAVGRAPPRAGSGAAGAAGGTATAALNAQIKELTDTVAEYAHERDFYFDKLREIELLLQAEVEAHPEIEADENGIIPRVQAILYSTAEGFEIPDADGAGDGQGHANEEETF